MSKFEVGDLVRCVIDDHSEGFLKYGIVYTVDKVTDDGDLEFNFSPGWFWKKYRFELVEDNSILPALTRPAPPMPMIKLPKEDVVNNPEPEYTGGSVNYYKVTITNPTTKGVKPYVAECNDIIEALGCNFAEGNIMKAIFRVCAAKHLGNSKKGYEDSVYDLEKIIFFAERLLAQEKSK